MTFSHRMNTSMATLAGSVLVCGAVAVAQTSAAPTPTQMPMPTAQQQSEPDMRPVDPNANTGQTTPMDMTFVESALKGGMAEVQLGQLALQKSSNDDVKQFAQKMIDDHTKLGNQMKPIALQIGVKMPDGPSKKDQATIAKLQALNGDAFDKAYIKDMVKDHKTDLSDFKAEAENGSNPAVKNAASQGSQIIGEHLKMIEQIEQQDGAMASSTMK